MPTTKLNGIAMASVAIGSLLMYSGVTGKSMVATLYSVVSGKSPKDVQQSYGISGQDSGTTASAPGSSSGPITNPSQAQQYAFSQFAKYGWGTDQQAPLVHLWNQESGWNNHAKNPSSGAYGIPQALPPSKLPFAGQEAGGSNAQVQIDWGLQYIKNHYGSPAMAWAHEQGNGWY